VSLPNAGDLLFEQGHIEPVGCGFKHGITIVRELGQDLIV
jgi:hypothetical protein